VDNVFKALRSPVEMPLGYVMENGEPDLVQARKTALMAHAVVIRLKEMGLPAELDDALAIVCTDLGDIWGSKEFFDGRLQALVEGPNDWAAVGDCLVDLKVAIEHLAFHANSIKEPIERLAHYAYEKGDE